MFVVASAVTPQPIIETVSEEIRKIMGKVEFGAMRKSDIARYAKIIKASNISDPAGPARTPCRRNLIFRPLIYMDIFEVT